MRLLKKGMVGADVKALVADLKAAGFPPAGKPTEYDSNVEKAVKAFQSRSIGPDGLPLVVDGQAGPLTRFALDVTLKRKNGPILLSLPIPAIGSRPGNASKTGWNALNIAKRELAAGAGETGGDNRGPDVMRYHAITGGKAGESWCASFVAYCFKEGNPGAMPYEATKGARATLKRFKDKGWDYKADFDNPPQAGDIIVWWRNKIESWEGHIGIVSGYSDGIVHTIEGNRGDYPSKVSAFHYKLGKINRLLGFARAKP